ncbi:MAG: aminotransferase class IV family protein [candidate division Zixibacteria bacterium]|nr:aminotransferase class IV family protein [candidate division Zixibacteria bacterium]
MAKTIVFIDGRQVDYRRATVSVFDYTLHCGIGLFESILGVEDRLILLNEHLDRMEQGIERLGLETLNYDRKKISRTLHRAVKLHPEKIMKVKVFLTQGGSHLWPGNKPKPKMIVMVTGHRLQYKKQRLIVTPMIITADNVLQGTKTLNYMTEWMSQRKAEEAGYDQGIIINAKGHITETGSSNIFIAKNDKLFTPPLSSGCLPGITRDEIMRLAKEMKIRCHEKHLTPDDLAHADEIFTSSSFKIIWPVVELKSKRTHKYQTGPISKVLFDCMKKNFLQSC